MFLHTYLSVLFYFMMVNVEVLFENEKRKTEWNQLVHIQLQTRPLKRGGGGCIVEMKFVLRRISA